MHESELNYEEIAGTPHHIEEDEEIEIDARADSIDDELEEDMNLISTVRRRENEHETERNAAREALFESSDTASRKRYRMIKRSPASVYHCKECDKTFKHPSKIKEHLRVHTGEKPFACPICPARFTQGHPLKVHLRTHRGERPFKCTFCEKCFVSLNLRKAHEKIHQRIVEDAEMMLMEEEFYGLPTILPNEAHMPETEESTQIFMCPLPRCGYINADPSQVEAHLDHGHSHQVVISDKSWQECVDGGEDFIVCDNSASRDDQRLLNIGEEVTVMSQEIDDPSFHPSSSFESQKIKQSRSDESAICSANDGYSEFEDHVVLEEFIPTTASGFGDMSNVLFKQEHSSNDEEEDGEEDGEGPSTGIRLYIDPSPAPRGQGRKTGTHFQKLEEVTLDTAYVEMVSPAEVSTRNKGDYKPARNLDWIIEAVARGQDVDSASPHHRRKPTTWFCKTCERVIKYPSRIEAHRQMHAGQKPYTCEICGMAFSQRTPMRLHVRRHLDQRPFVCVIDSCGQRFVSGAILNNHQKEKHFGQMRRYFCMKGCGATFGTSQKRHQHETVCTFVVISTELINQQQYEENLLEENGDEEEVPFLGDGTDEISRDHFNEQQFV